MTNTMTDLERFQQGLEELDAEFEAEQTRKDAYKAAKKAKASFATDYPAVHNWLNDYRGNFEFYVSVQKQYFKNGFLSEKQREAIERAVARDAARTQAVEQKPAAEALWANPTFPAGSLLKISRGIAKAIAEEKGYAYPFMNVEVVKTHKETFKAVLVTIKFSAQIGRCCGICGRGLDTEVSRATGIGPICADKIGLTRYSVAEAKTVLVELSEKLNLLGEVQVWLPKSKVTKM